MDAQAVGGLRLCVEQALEVCFERRCWNLLGCQSRGSVEVSVSVQNNGTTAGDEVVQLYFSDTATGLVRPAQELVGFRRISLKPGEVKTVSFTVKLEQLAYLGVNGATWVLEPGPIDVLIGSASDDIRARASFDVSEQTAQLGRSRSFLSEARVR